MRVFDFENGEKGILLGEVQLPSSLGATLSDGDDYIHITISGCSYHNSANFEMDGLNGELPILPSNYIIDGIPVTAICFCTGLFDNGTRKGEWDWCFLATPDWLTRNGYPTKDGIALLKEAK